MGFLPRCRKGPLLSDNVRKQMLIGTPDQIRQRLAQYEQLGIQEMLLYFPDARDLESVRLFAQECMKQ